VSRKRRGKSKKSRGPRPPKPPRIKGELTPSLRPLASEGPTAAEIEEWNANQEPDEFETWGEKVDSEETELKEWADLDEVEAELANLVGAFVEEFPACGSLDRAQEAFEAVCLEGLVNGETSWRWAAGLIHYLVERNSGLDTLSPEEICRRFEVPVGTSAEWAQKVAAAVQADPQG